MEEETTTENTTENDDNAEESLVDEDIVEDLVIDEGIEVEEPIIVSVLPCPKCGSTNTKIVADTNYYTCFGYVKKNEETDVWELIQECGHTWHFITGSRIHCPKCWSTDLRHADDGDYSICNECETPFVAITDEVIHPYHNLTFPTRDQEEFYRRDIIEVDNYEVPNNPYF